MLWWGSVLVFGFLATIIGLILPLVPGLPWLFFVNLALEKLCPNWWEQQWLYRMWIVIKRKLKPKIMIEK